MTSAGYLDDCYVALELSQKTWLVGYLLPDACKVKTITVPGGNTTALMAVLDKMRTMTGSRQIQKQQAHAAFVPLRSL